MVEKLDNRRPDSSGYITQVPELLGILSELTPLLSVGIHEGFRDGRQPDLLSVEVKLGFTISRTETKLAATVARGTKADTAPSREFSWLPEDA